MSDNSAIINRLIIEATEALFDSYEFPTAYRQSVDGFEGSALDHAGIVGFAGDDLSGSLALATTGEVLHASMRAIPGATSARDWLGELSNQLCGRLKMKLIGYGATIYLSTPLAIEGAALKVRLVGDHGIMGGHLFKTPAGDLHVWLGADLRDGLTLVQQTDQEELPSEGDMMLF